RNTWQQGARCQCAAACRRSGDQAGAARGSTTRPTMTYSGDRILLGSQRESRISRFRPWVLFVVPLIAILFQVYVPRFFEFLAYLDLPLLVTVYFALMRRSPVAGTFIGAMIGLAQDSLSKNPLGLYGIVKTLVGYFAASVGLRFDVDHSFIRL